MDHSKNSDSDDKSKSRKHFWSKSNSIGHFDSEPHQKVHIDNQRQVSRQDINQQTQDNPLPRQEAWPNPATNSQTKSNSFHSQNSQNLTNEKVDLTPENYFEEWQQRINIEEEFDKTEERERENVILQEYDDKNETIIFYQIFDKKERAIRFLNRIKKFKNIRVIAEQNQMNFEGAPEEIDGPTVESKNRFKCQVAVNFGSGNFSYIKNQGELQAGSKWTIEENKPSFYQQMRENLDKFNGHDHMKDLIVNLAPPEYQNDGTHLADFRNFCAHQRHSLNKDQINAIEKSLLTKDYNIVVGMPGTGKTYAIVVLLLFLIKRGDKILLSAHTHFAIDNILIRFLKEYPEHMDKILRFGSKKDVDKSLHDLVYQKSKLDNGEEPNNIFQNKKIFAATCLAAGNAALKNIDFDVCIIDEASQIVEPVVIGSILLAKKFILFGDHNQLPPIVKSGAKDRGMSVSLFERLAKRDENLISWLTIQYRMNEDIMAFSNTNIYQKKMKCLESSILNGRMKVPKPNLFDGWVKEVINPENTKSQLQTHNLRGKKVMRKRSFPEDIGVITPLRDDRSRVKDLLAKEQVPSYTIDGSQGIDKSCIIINISLMKNRIRPLLSDWRRVNVAFTRPKHKLIVIGSFAHLKDIDHIGSFIKMIETKRRVLIDKKKLELVEKEVILN